MNRRNNLTETLSKRLAHYGLANSLNSTRICEIANNTCEGDFKSISYKDGVLKVACSNNTKAHLVSLNKRLLMRKINDGLGKETIKNIVVLAKR